MKTKYELGLKLIDQESLKSYSLDEAINLKEIRIFQTRSGIRPFANWIEFLNDKKTVSRIYARLDRLATGHYGDYKSVRDGVLELRLHFGSGYRIYFAEAGEFIVILLVGGDKASRFKDIALAKKYWKSLRGEQNEQEKDNTEYRELP